MKQLSSVVTPTPPRLTDWMGDLMPVLANLTIHDLALPGTHDTLTYDLSQTVADNANDLPAWAAHLLHAFHNLDGFVGRFIRAHAQTQTLDVAAQLDAGARFLDLRATYTSGPHRAAGRQDWYSLHMVESNRKFVAYIDAIAAWMRAHPHEVVAIFLTRHGCEQCTGAAQFPGATNAEKQACWAQVKGAFAAAGVGLIPNTVRLNETALSALVARNTRAVVYAGDWANFTGSDPLAWDAARYMYNGGAGQDVQNLPAAFAGWDAFYRNNRAKRAQLKASDTFFLVSLAGSPPPAVVEDAAKVAAAAAVGLHPRSLLEECAARTNIPNLSAWCPATLDAWERLRNFYSQVFLDRVVQGAFQDAYSPPGAIYMDALGPGGTTRTDTPESDKHGFAYADTLILWSVRQVCRGSATSISPACKAAEAALSARRARNPVVRWDDPLTGRHMSWPALRP